MIIKVSGSFINLAVVLHHKIQSLSGTGMLKFVSLTVPTGLPFIQAWMPTRNRQHLIPTFSKASRSSRIEKFHSLKQKSEGLKVNFFFLFFIIDWLKGNYLIGVDFRVCLNRSVIKELYFFSQRSKCHSEEFKKFKISYNLKILIVVKP